MRYTQDAKVEVIVRGEGVLGDGEGKQPKGAKTTDEETEATPANVMARLTGTTNPRKQRRIIITNATHFFAVARQTALLGINYALTGVGYNSGDQAYQDRVQRSWDIANEVASIGSATAMGAIYGARGGPIGLIVGTSLGLISSTASVATKYAYKRREYDFQTFKQNSAIEYQRARAGINLTTGRLR